jgi:hypothetical protein
VGVLAERTGAEVWTLEHSPVYHEQTQRRLARHHISTDRLTLAPLKDYGEFAWYDAPLDRMPSDFRLVIADAPPGDTEGGRYGLLPVMRGHIAPGCAVLLDDCERAAERAVLERWSHEFGLTCHLDDDRAQKAWGVCVAP